MSRFGFCGGAYQAEAFSADQQSCINLYAEKNESGAAKSELCLLSSPGLSLFSTLPDAPLRGEWQVQIPNSPQRAFAVSGSTLFEVFADGTFLARGNVVNNGKPASLASSNIQLMIASGGQGYCLNFASNLLTGPIATIAGVTQVGYSDGFFTAAIGGTAQFFVSAPLDGTSWDPAQTAIVSVFPDNIISAIVDHREILLFGQKQSQGYYDSGNTFPYDVIPGGFCEQGSAATFGVTRADNTIFGIWKDERGAGVAFRLQGATPQRISTHAIEFAWQGYARMDDAEAYSFQLLGHTFVHWYFPAANKSWRYDVATGLWHEVAFWNGRSFDAHRSRCHMMAFGKHLVGDPITGSIYQMDIPKADGLGGWNFVTDFGNPIRRVRRSPYVGSAGEYNYFKSLEIMADTGLASLPAQVAPTQMLLADANGVIWALTVNDDGTLSISVSFGAPSTLILNDPGNTTSWQIGVTIGGLLTTTAVLFKATNPVFAALVSSGVQLGGSINYQLQVTNAGALQTVAGGPVLRSPQMMLKWSKDGGHTWSNERFMDMGQIGQFGKRMIERRLPRVWGSTAIIWEVSFSDMAPLRITDADLVAEPDLGQSGRLAQKLRAQA